MTTKRQQITDEVEAATEAVISLEALPEGQPFAAAADRAAETIAALAARARSIVFPDTLAPSDAGTLLDVQSYLPTHPHVAFVEEMIQLHAVAYDSLREAIRSPRVMRLIIVNARGTAVIRDMDEQAAVEADRVKFETGIAAELAARGEQLPGAQILGEIVPALRSRLVIAKGRHEQAAAEAVARLRREQEEADRVLSEMKANQEREAIATRAASEAEMRRAEVRARQLHAERIAGRIRRAGLQNLRVGGVHYAAANLLELLDSNSFSEAQLAAYEDALDKQEGVRA